jgi:glycine cleavage system H protein
MVPFCRAAKRVIALRNKIQTKGTKAMSYPEAYRYTKSHQWLLLEGQNATIGITEYAQSSLGDIKFVDLPKIGQAVEADSTFGSVESMKSVSDLYSPVTGEVSAVNEELGKSPELINKDANNTWIIKVAVKDSKASETLSASEYEKFTTDETAG